MLKFNIFGLVKIVLFQPQPAKYLQKPTIYLL